MSVGSWATRHELALFFVLAFALSWAPRPLVLATDAADLGRGGMDLRAGHTADLGPGTPGTCSAARDRGD